MLIQYLVRALLSVSSGFGCLVTIIPGFIGPGVIGLGFIFPGLVFFGFADFYGLLFRFRQVQVTALTAGSQEDHHGYQ